MADCTVLGLGNWGTALANHLAAKGLNVLGWSIDPSIVDGINTDRRNPMFQQDVVLAPGLRATGDLSTACNSPLIILAVPSSALHEIVPRLAVQSGTLVVSAIKGLDKESLLTPLQYVERYMRTPLKTVVLSGPSFAADLVLHRPVGIVSASVEEGAARTVAELFNNQSMKVYISTDPLGVELGGVLKNVIALAAGVCDGLALGESARAGLITRGLAEMTRLAVAMGAKEQTLMGLSGLGDLAMTAASATSRNRTVGYRLGKGEALHHILQTIGSVAEGVATTPLMLELGKRYEVELPIAEAVGAVLSGAATAQEMARSLILRPIRREF
ncbi:MAG: NAD(P)-dependent glycerol-3-phosphate dehydrogenase [Proteobacteria bacterium]|nr:NAD(P)-dependent glycerol-3-phosphate dehydrogenase [Pseudomonadota bacterium]